MIPRMPFGRTGHNSSRVIFGAAGLGANNTTLTARVMTQLLEAGVNHIDTASTYGESELALAPFLSEHRNEVFLATKARKRDGAEARAELEASLSRMGVDQVDLIQLHNLVEPEEWEQAHRRGGALETMVKARDEGLVRFIGVTGHGTRIPGMHLRSLNEFDYDSVLLPYNHSMMSDDAYRGDVEALLNVCAERNVGVQTIKSIARRRWADKDNAAGERRFSWYQPLEDAGAIARAARYVLSNSQVFLNTSSDVRYLDPVLAAAAGDLACPDDNAMEADNLAFGIKALFDGGDLERI